MNLNYRLIILTCTGFGFFNAMQASSESVSRFTRPRRAVHQKRATAEVLMELAGNKKAKKEPVVRMYERNFVLCPNADDRGVPQGVGNNCDRLIDRYNMCKYERHLETCDKLTRENRAKLMGRAPAAPLL